MKFELDPKNPPPLTTEQRGRLKAIAVMPGTEINYSDIKRQTEHMLWTRPGASVPAENKQQVTLRLDVDVLNFQG